ncbi:MAG: LD-carboxypeptidase [Bacteroidota bacterium]
MIKTPPYLQPGDTIGLICPAGYMALEKAEECVRVLKDEWGYNVKVGATIGGSSVNYFSGTDEERLNDFQQMLDDEEVKAVCVQGAAMVWAASLTR